MTSLAASILKAVNEWRDIDVKKRDLRTNSGKFCKWSQQRVRRLRILCESGHSRSEIMDTMGLTDNQYDQALIRFDIDTEEKRIRRERKEAKA